MYKMNLNETQYRCSCRKELITSSNLRNHLKLPYVHKVNSIPIQAKPKKLTKLNSENQALLQRSIKNLFLDKHKNIMNIFSKISKCCLTLKPLDELYYEVSYDDLLKTLQTIRSKKFRLSLSYAGKILNELQKLPIKEITKFKNYKSNFKLAFKGFLKKSTSSINVIAITPNERYLVSGGSEGVVKIWDPLHLVIIKNLCFHSNRINCIDIDPRSEYLLSGGHDRTICLWSLKSMRLQKYFVGHSNFIISAKFLHSSEFFISGSGDKTIRVWNTLKNSLIWLLQLELKVCFILIPRSINQNLVCGSKTKIFQVNLKDKQYISSIQRNSMVLCGIFIENNTKVALGYEDGLLQVLVYSDFRLFNGRKAHYESINAIEFIQGKNMLVTASNDCMIIFQDAITLNPLNCLQFHLSHVLCIKFGLNRLYSSGNDGKIHYYNIHQSKPVNVSETKAFLQTSLALSIELHLIAFGLKRLRLYCLKREIELESVIIKGIITCLAFAKSIIVCGNDTGELLLLDSPSLEEKMKYVLSKTPIFYCLLSKDYNLFTYSLINKSMIVDFKLGKILFSHGSQICVATLDEKQNLLAFCDSTFKIIVLKNYSTLIEISENLFCYQLYLSSDKTRLLVRNLESNFLMFSLNRGKCESKAKKLRELKAKIKFPKNVVLTSCLSYNHYLR